MIFVIAIVVLIFVGIEVWDKITDHLASAWVIVLSLVGCSRASLQPLDAKAVEHFKIALRFDVFGQRGNAARLRSPARLGIQREPVCRRVRELPVVQVSESSAMVATGKT
jgi:hypothetical protein